MLALKFGCILLTGFVYAFGIFIIRILIAWNGKVDESGACLQTLPFIRF